MAIDHGLALLSYQTSSDVGENQIIYICKASSSKYHSKSSQEQQSGQKFNYGHRFLILRRLQLSQLKQYENAAYFNPGAG